MNPRLVALGTGASRGIGRSIAIELVRTHAVQDEQLKSIRSAAKAVCGECSL